MNRWLVVLLVVLALIVLISPGIVGRLAEQNIEDGIAWTEEESPGVTIETETFERGWFTSVGQHRVVLDGAQFGATADSEQLPSLVIDTRVDHGLLPVSSLGRDGGSLAPGLASTVSTFRIDLGDGETVELPGTLSSTVGLSGASDSHLLMEEGSFIYDGASVQWQETDLNMQADPNSRSTAIEGNINSLRVMTDDANVGFESIEIDADQGATEYGFSIGTADVNLTELTIAGGGGPLSVAGLKINADSTVDDARLSGKSSFSINQFTAPTGDVVDIDLQVSIADFDAPSIGAITKAMQESQGSSNPQAALAEVFPSIEGDLQTLLSRGASFNIDKLEISLPQGVVSTKVAIAVAEADQDDAFSWPGVLLDTTASVDIRVPIELFEMAAAMSPEAGSLLAMGILQKDGSDYVMEANYAKGLVNVNGAPMPIPIPGL